MASSRTATRPSRSSLAMVEKVDAEVVNGEKSATAVKTEELIGSAKDVYSSVAVRREEGGWRVIMRGGGGSSDWGQGETGDIDGEVVKGERWKGKRKRRGVAVVEGGGKSVVVKVMAGRGEGE